MLSGTSELIPMKRQTFTAPHTPMTTIGAGIISRWFGMRAIDPARLPL